MRVRDVMSHPVITVAPTTEAAIAARVLYSHGFTALPVVDVGRLVGIVTEADLITAPPEDGAHRWRRGSATGPLRVGEVMTSPVESLTPGAEAVDAARIMVDERIRCLPIVDGRHVVGILTRRDLLEAGVVDTRPSEREPNY